MGEKDPLVTVEVIMTLEQYVNLKVGADWYFKTVAEYLRDNALGTLPKGC